MSEDFSIIFMQHMDDKFYNVLIFIYSILWWKLRKPSNFLADFRECQIFNTTNLPYWSLKFPIWLHSPFRLESRWVSTDLLLLLLNNVWNMYGSLMYFEYPLCYIYEEKKRGKKYIHFFTLSFSPLFLLFFIKFSLKTGLTLRRLPIRSSSLLSNIHKII